METAGTTVFLGDCENRLVLVKIYEAAAELPDQLSSVDGVIVVVCQVLGVLRLPSSSTACGRLG